jgi:hypothetical protein
MISRIGGGNEARRKAAGIRRMVAAGTAVECGHPSKMQKTVGVHVFCSLARIRMIRVELFGRRHLWITSHNSDLKFTKNCGK